MIKPYYRSGNGDFTLVRGDVFETLEAFDFRFDAIFADPPYFLSNGGISCHAGKVVSVDKGDWDRGLPAVDMDAFNRRWLELCRQKLVPGGTIWVSGTYHNIFSVANQMTRLGYKILNVITWAKTNPPPNISCRYFTYSTEFVIWARREAKVPHYYDYKLMRHINGDKQMTDVWRLPAIGRWEKEHGKHPTQKPLSLLTRIVLASTPAEGGWIMDPFSGSATTGIAANLCGRRYLGIDREQEYMDIAVARRGDLDNPATRRSLEAHLSDLVLSREAPSLLACQEPAEGYQGRRLPF